MKTVITTLRFVTLAVLLVSSTAWDVTQRRIPNFITVPAVVVGLILWAAQTWPQGALTWLGGLALGFGLLLIPFAMGGMGAGDVKLAAAVGALMGPGFVLKAVLYGALAGGVISAFYLMRAGRLVVTLRTALWNLGAVFAPKLPFIPLPKLSDAKNQATVGATGAAVAFPYGVAIALGSVAAIIWR